LLPALALVLLLGTVGVAQAAGWWLVSGREMVNVEQLTGGADVKGWMTLQQVADGTGMATAALYAKLGLPADIPPETALKDLEGVTKGFEIATVRTVVDEALGVTPVASAEKAVPAAPVPPGTAAPVTAATVSPEPTVSPAATAVVDPTATAAQTPAGTGSGTGSTEGETRPAVTSATSIKGSHTLQEIVNATGVEMAALLAALELPPATDPHTAVRELVAAGLLTEVDQVRAAVGKLQ
jgi:hypothetical protein